MRRVVHVSFMEIQETLNPLDTQSLISRAPPKCHMTPQPRSVMISGKNRSSGLTSGPPKS